MQARIGVLAVALFVLLGAVGAAAQEVVLTNGSRLAGTVEKYEGGFAYIRLVKEGGKTVLTTLPESAIDKEATASQGSATTDGRAAEPQKQRQQSSGPFKLPHNDLSRSRVPGVAAIAAEEKERRVSAVHAGEATGRVFKNGQRASGIPTAREIEALADLREQPQTQPDMDAAARVTGLKFYEVRLETLSSAFAQLGQQWHDMWSHCTPRTYVGAAGTSTTQPVVTRPDIPYRDAVLNSFRDNNPSKPSDDRWSVSCVRRDSDFLARGRDVVEAYDSIFEAYTSFADATGQSSQAVARVLPANP